MRQWDVGWVVSVHSTTALVEQVRAAAEGNRPMPSDTAEEIEQLEELVRGGDAADDQDLADLSVLDASEAETEPDGQIVAVWGAVGAPGRTTVAVNLAAELARSGKTTLIVDADTYGACVGQWLALLDEAPGIAAAIRLAESGRLDVLSLAAVAPVVLPNLRVLTGISRAARWPEISEEVLTEVLRTARTMVDFVIVDCAAAIEQDEELSYDTVAPRRNAATLAALHIADLVLAVGSADLVSLQRLVRALEEVRPVIAAEPRVVVTRLRASAVGASPRTRVSEALTRFAGVRDLTLIPEDRESIDAALLSGAVLAGSSPNSAARLAIADLAAELSGAPATRRRHRLSTLRRAGRSI